MKKYIYSLIALVMLSFAACTPDDYSMGSTGITSADLQKGIAFTVTKDAANPNLVHLKSLLKGRTAVWKHVGVGLGHSQGDSVNLQIAFAGTYPIVYGVNTPGGTVYSDTIFVTEDKFCADFVSGDEWTYLAGGAGNSKTWVPDNGNYEMKQGFYSCFDPTAVYTDMTHDDGLNNWYAKGKTWWEPSNSDVGITASDLAQTMTFSLKGNAGITVTDASGNATTGSFTFDPTSHALNADGVEFVHGAWANGKSLSFSKNFYVLHLDKNQLMIGNLRDQALSGEGSCWYVWNFVSKDYADNYKPAEVTEPTLPSGWSDLVTKQTKTDLTWVLDADVPFDYFTLAGKRKNTYSGNSDYPSLITPLSGLGKYQLTLSGSNNTYKLKNTESGVIAEGTYTVDSKGIYTFDKGLSKALIGGDWVYLNADADNQLRLLSYTYSDSYSKVTDIWLGAKQNDNDGNLYQYLGYHFTAAPDANAKATYKTVMTTQSKGFSRSLSSDPVLVDGDGIYTSTINGSESEMYCLYLDVTKLLVDHSKATLDIVSISVDGQVTNVDWSYTAYTRNSDGTQLTADTKGDGLKTPRIYPCNPWIFATDKTVANDGDADNPNTVAKYWQHDSSTGDRTINTLFNFSSSISITFKVSFND
jgi:hypothetical protein